jgi:phage tail sheath gpL-like
MPDSITFQTIPLDWWVPGAWLEIDHSRAVRGLPVMRQRVLLLGQRLPTGSAPAGTLKRITRNADGVDYFGRGSMLAQMIPAVLAVYPTADLHALALDDLAAGAKATGTLTFSGAPSETGTLNLYIGGRAVRVGITAGDTPAAVAQGVAAAVTALPDLPVTAGVTDAVVTLTARHKGLEANAIDLRLNYYDGEATPRGLVVTIASMSGGTGNPDVLDAIAAMSSGAYYTIVMPWTDVANLTAIETELQSRWGGLDMRTGHAFGFKAGSFSELATFGSARNSPHTTIVGLKGSPTLPWVAAAQFAAVVAQSGAIDPAIPFRDLALPDVLAPLEADRFIDTERNLLLHDHISTIKFDSANVSLVEQVITTYGKNSSGVDDESLLKLNTKWTVDYMRYTFRVAVQRDYPRHKLAGDDVLQYIQPGQKIATPKLIRNTLIATAGQLVEVGLLEDIDQLKRDLIVRRSETNTNRVNAVLPPNVVNQFDVFAAAVQYIL